MVSEMKLGSNWSLREEDGTGDIVLEDRINTVEIFRSSTNGPFELGGSNLDLGGNAITDTTQDFVDLTGDGNDIRIATDQSIEDGSGARRIDINSGETYIYDNAGNISATFRDGARNAISAFSTTPFQVFDQEGTFVGLEYNTSASAPGTLELTNANLDANENTLDTVGGIDFENNGENTFRINITTPQDEMSFAAGENNSTFSANTDILTILENGAILARNGRFQTESGGTDNEGSISFAGGDNNAEIYKDTTDELQAVDGGGATTQLT